MFSTLNVFRSFSSKEDVSALGLENGQMEQLSFFNFELIGDYKGGKHKTIVQTCFSVFKF